MHLDYFTPLTSVELFRVIIVIKLNVQDLLDKKKETRYWLVKNMDSNYETINRLCDNRTVALQLETIEKLCRVLECTPNDLFSFE